MTAATFTKPFTGSGTEETTTCEVDGFTATATLYSDRKTYGVAVTIARNGVQLIHQFNAARWGIERHQALDIANELLPKALKEAEAAWRDPTATWERRHGIDPS